MHTAVAFQVHRLRSTAELPKKSRPDDAAFDLTTDESATIAPGERHTFGLGFAAEFPTEFVALVRDRSSLGSRGLHCLAGVIDATYRGEWKVVVLNTSADSQTIQAGDRIAQCLFLPVPNVTVTEVTELSSSERGHGGFGSTGK